MQFYFVDWAAFDSILLGGAFDISSCLHRCLPKRSLYCDSEVLLLVFLVNLISQFLWSLLDLSIISYT